MQSKPQRVELGPQLLCSTPAKPPVFGRYYVCCRHRHHTSPAFQEGMHVSRGLYGQGNDLESVVLFSAARSAGAVAGKPAGTRFSAVSEFLDQPLTKCSALAVNAFYADCSYMYSVITAADCPGFGRLTGTTASSTREGRKQSKPQRLESKIYLSNQQNRIIIVIVCFCLCLFGLFVFLGCLFACLFVYLFV